MKKYLFVFSLFLICCFIYADTETLTETPDISATETIFISATEIWTNTPSPTYTVTGLQTVSFTETISNTFTPTETSFVSPIETFTETMTPTITPTETETLFVSPTDSNIWTITATPTMTWTFTPVPTYSLPFFDDFSTDLGWNYGPEWERGYATLSSGHVYGFPDPAFDHSPSSDNILAGVVIGGNASTVVHDFYFLTSPVINAEGIPSLEFRFWRYLNSDYLPFMESVVEVFDGTNWVRIYSNGGAGVNDSYWQEQVYDVTAYANPNFQVRFGHYVGSAGVYVVSSWNVDDVYIGPPLPSPTITQTWTISQTWTITETFTISPTHSISPTSTDTATISPTHSISPTFTITPTSTITFTVTVTHTPISPYGIGIDWEIATSNAGFTPRQGHSGAVFNNKMWVIAGSGNSNIATNDVWSSTDGINWVMETSSAGFSPRTSHSTVVFNNKLWVIAGVNYVSGEKFNDVWSSTDGINWTQETASALFDHRYLHTSVVFNNKIYVIAGYGPSGYLCDVWSSFDGITWVQENSYAPFSPRCGLTSVVANERIYIFNGYDTFRNMKNDVWSSNDGINWVCETSVSPYKERMSNAMAFINGLIWMIGGYNYSFFNDVWVAPDGKYWTRIASSADFTPRAGFAMLYYNDKLWVIGGRDSSGKVKNDVWYSPPEDKTPTPSVTSTPVLSETELKINDVLIYPHPFNPKKQDDLKIKFYLTHSCKEVSIKIYTAALRLIKSEVILTNATAGNKQCFLSAQKLLNLSNGLYYFILEAEDKDKKIRSKADYLVILK